jgi:major outer membrane protein
MKKIVMTALVMLSCEVVYALPIGNPAEASLLTWGVWFPCASCNPFDPCFCWFDAWSIRAGYYGDFVFNRNLQLEENGFNQGKVIERTEIFTNAGYLALNVCNKLDVFGTLGASRLSITTNETSWFLGGNAEGRLDWESTFSWSAGARGTLFERNRFLIGIEGQYFQTSPDLTTYLSFSDGLYNYFNEDNKMRYQEWQIATGISYALTCFSPNISLVPYSAVKWSWARLRTGDFQFIKTGTDDLFTIFNLNVHKLWGFAVGTSVTFCDMVSFTVEGRWADESAFYVNGQFRF